MDAINLFKSDIPGCDLSLYFSESELKNMKTIEKMIKFNKLKNYFGCQSLNLESEMPDFMKKSKNVYETSKDVNLIKLPEDLKRLLLFSEISLSHYETVKSKIQAESKDCDDLGGELDLPLCKNVEYKKLLWYYMCQVAPAVIKEMEQTHEVKKKALEMFKNKEIGINGLHIFFPSNLESLEQAIDNLSIEQEDKVKNSRYAFRNLAKKDYCENELKESDSEDEDKLQSTAGDGACSVLASTRGENSGATPKFDVAGKTPKPLKWNFPKTFAAKTVPDGLALRCSNLPNAVLGIFTSRQIEKNSIVGPYVGVNVYYESITKVSGRLWEIYVNNYRHHYINGEDPEISNWMRYVNYAARAEDQNLEAFQQRYKIYYRAMRDIPPDTELLVWYSESYNQDCLDVDSKSRKSTQQRKIKSVVSQNKANAADIATSTATTITTREDPAAVTTTTKVDSATDSKHDVGQIKEKPFKCKFCCKYFKTKGGMNMHIRTHTGEKPYKCEVCNVAFACSGNLQCHIRTHTGEKPYKCEVCNVAFTCSGNLQCHIRIHTGEKPYKCEVCLKMFGQISNLKRHERTIHAVK